jgi:beta-xylosidase
MRRRTIFNLISFLAFIAIGVSCKDVRKGRDPKKNSEASTYKNPLAVKFGDPYILNDGSGKYYMYGTGGGAENGFVTYSSKDLVNWRFEGQVYSALNENAWGISSFWAPEVYKFGSKYYMFYSAQWKENPENELENFKIGVAVSNSPQGPFKDLENRPLFNPEYPVIDANVFKDSNGEFYLYYSRVCYKHPVESDISEWAKEKGWFDEIEESWVYGVKLAPDFKSVFGEPVLLLRPPESMDDENAEWESRSVTSREVNRRWTEGSYIFKQKGIYYIMYSANYFGGENYAVGYATGNSPLGPFVKSRNNPILERNVAKGGEVTGTGHNSLVFLNDSSKIYTVYHGRTKITGDERAVFMDELKILDNGELKINGPSTSNQPLPISDSEN